MKIVFADHAWDDFTYWIENDRKIARRIARLIKEIERDPWAESAGQNHSNTILQAFGLAASPLSIV